jgi:glycosyltransferase involved in cell wall biosynthesis
MRILILHSRYRSGPVSGENRVVEDESRLLRESGHEVHLWTPSPEGLRGIGLVRTGLSSVWSRAAEAETRRLVRRHRIAVVHAHNLVPMLSPAVLRGARSGGAAVVLTLHNYRMMCLPASLLRDGKLCELCIGRFPWPGVEFRCYRNSTLGSGALALSLGLHRATGSFDRVSRFLAISRFVRDKHIQAGIPPARITVKPNFVWPGSPREGPGDYFLYLGRLSPEKGVGTLIRAWQQVPARLVVVGEGPEAAQLRAEAPPGVTFRGRVSFTDLGRVLAGARALLVPSRWYEPAGRVALEAYASGVPVVASRIGALPEFVEDGVTGLLADPYDPEDWAGAVIRLGDDREAERLGAGAFSAWSHRYSPQRGIRNLEAAYRQALDEAGRTGNA